MLPLRCSRPSISFSKSQLLAVDDRQAPFFRLRGVDQHAFHRVSCYCQAARVARAATTMQRDRRINPWLESPWTAGRRARNAPIGPGSVGACVSARRAGGLRCRPRALHRGQRPTGDVSRLGIGPASVVGQGDGGRAGHGRAVSLDAGARPRHRVSHRESFGCLVRRVLLLVSRAAARPPLHLKSACRRRLHYHSCAGPTGRCGPRRNRCRS